MPQKINEDAALGIENGLIAHFEHQKEDGKLREVVIGTLRYLRTELAGTSQAVVPNCRDIEFVVNGLAELMSDDPVRKTGGLNEISHGYQRLRQKIRQPATT